MMLERNVQLSTSTSPRQNNYPLKPTNYHRHRKIAVEPRKRKEALWIDWKSSADADKTPFKFTGKELDAETGLYYYGARYLDPKTSRWMSTDPAMGEYLPSAPVNEEAKKRNGNLPGMGGVFNYVNLHVYHYAGNNPVKYVDPDGRKTTIIYISNKNDSWNKIAGGSHVALYVDNPGSSSNGMVWVDPVLYDPSGSFYLPETAARPKDAIFTEDVNDGSILEKFLDYHLGLGSEITLFQIDTNSIQEADILETACNNGERYLLFPMSCAKDVSAALKGLGINQASTPGGLKKQMETMVENGKAQKFVIENKPKSGELIQ